MERPLRKSALAADTGLGRPSGGLMGARITPISGLKCATFSGLYGARSPYAWNSKINLDGIGGVTRHVARHPFPTRIPPLRVCKPNKGLR
jgi:hypothetical protein